jgi:ribonuclease III
MTDPDPKLVQLEDRLGYRFKQPALLIEALTHGSYLQDNAAAGAHNQRLEFLGDAVLQLILTEILYDLYPDEREGMLSKRRTKLIEGKFLAALAGEIGLDACLRLGNSEEANGGRTKASALEDAFEALAGAIFLDAGFYEATRVIRSIYGSLPQRLEPVLADANPKGRLQELTQPVHGNTALRYEFVSATGPLHAQQYAAAVFLNNVKLGEGRGSSKKSAEEEAARMALAALREKEPEGSA